MKIRFAVAPSTPSPSREDGVAFAEVVEASGFDGLWLSDLPISPIMDPLLGLALAAGRTSRLKLGANVVPLGRNPFLLAKQLAQLDHISNGRLLLSFVTGLEAPGEREVLGLSGITRGEALEEVLALLRAWWAGETVEYHSQRWSYSGVQSVARPLQEPLEVWLGGHGPKALDRVGRVADGWLGAQVTPAEAALARERIEAAADGAGRQVDPEHFGLSIPYARARPGAEVLRGIAARRPGVDPLTLLPVGKAAIRSFLEHCIEGGLSKFVLRPASPVRSWADEAGWLADAILELQS
jgi:probable F420-dependent oxidoreductase